MLANVTLVPQMSLLDKTYEKKKHAKVLPAFGEPSGHACRVSEEAHGSELEYVSHGEVDWLSTLTRRPLGNRSSL